MVTTRMLQDWTLKLSSKPLIQQTVNTLPRLMEKTWRKSRCPQGPRPLSGQLILRGSSLRLLKFSRRLRLKDSLMPLILTYFYYWRLVPANKYSKKPLVTCMDLSAKELILEILSMRYLVASQIWHSTTDSCQVPGSRLHTALLPFFGE